MDKAAWGYALAGIGFVGTFVALCLKIITTQEALLLLAACGGVAGGTSYLRAKSEPARIEKVSGTGDGTKKE